MKTSSHNILLLSALASVSFIASSYTNTAPITYKVDVENSKLRWTGYYLFSFSEHNGSIELSKGEIQIDKGQMVSGYFEIDMKSIRDLDMAAGEEAKDLDEHLKNDDFFSVGKFPTAHFEIRKTEKIKNPEKGGPNYDVTGDLTLKGVSNSLTFPDLLVFKDNSVEAKAKFKFDRTKWNVHYNSGKIFSDIGDGAISDAIGIELHLFTSK